MTDDAAPTPDDDDVDPSATQWDEYFLHDGRARIPLADGKVVMLRVPKFGELKALRRKAREDQANGVGRQNRQAELLDELTKLKDAAGGVSAERATELRYAIADLNDEATESLLNWYAEHVIPTLGDLAKTSKEPLTADDMPVWLADAQFTTRLNRLWASTPRRPGG